MTAPETLREAAALMRARAEAATPGPWNATHDPLGHHVEDGFRSRGRLAMDLGSDVPVSNGRADAAHIASWHPAVALAVADWLDIMADCAAVLEGFDLDPSKTEVAALAVARAYLGRDS